jgi:hypothetical protein
MLEMKDSINQMKSTTHGLDQVEERISEIEDKNQGILHADNHKEKKMILMIATYKNSGIERESMGYS